MEIENLPKRQQSGHGQKKSQMSPIGHQHSNKTLFTIFLDSRYNYIKERRKILNEHSNYSIENKRTT